MRASILHTILFIAGFFLSAAVGAQSGTAQTEGADKRSDFRKLDIFPAISYAPETSLTLGAIGIHYFDLSKGEQLAPVSNIEFLAVYTLRRQILAETRWEVFWKGSRWRTRGELFFNRYPDRNYGWGNRAAALVAETVEDGEKDTLNYLNFDSDRIKFSPVILKKIGKNLFLGLQYDMEYLYRVRVIPESYVLINEASAKIASVPVEGFRSGFGIQMLFDNRDFILNPIRGNLVEFNVLAYGKYIGSEFNFTKMHLDARKYVNTMRNHTLAMRAVGSLQFTNDRIPMRGLSRVGGHNFIRGYFKGTYQDHHMTAFELEYRLPLWREGNESKLWQVWKRIGLVGFASAAQVYRNVEDWRFDRFNMAVGVGLRILFNPESRVNLRIDYAFGLRKNSNGIKGRQSGFYFYLGEAF